LSCRLTDDGTNKASPPSGARSHPDDERQEKLVSAGGTTQQQQMKQRRRNYQDDDDIMTSKMNVRSWFENLASGEERAASSAVSDSAFIGMFLATVCKGSPNASSEEVSSSLEATKIPSQGKGIEEMNESIQGKELTNVQTIQTSTTNNIEAMPEENKNGPLDGSINIEAAVAVGESKSQVDETTAKGEVDNSIATSKETVDKEPPKEEFVSTAIRIPHETAIRIPHEAMQDRINVATTKISKNSNMTDSQDRNSSNRSFEEKEELDKKLTTTFSAPKETTTTTLHFKSGSIITITNTHDSNKNKSVIPAVAERKRDISILPNIPKLDTDATKPGNDVDRQIHFSALKPQAMRTPTQIDRDAASRKKKAQRIAQSKMSASRALSMQRPSTNANNNINNNNDNYTENIIQHIRLVFASALGLMTNFSTNADSSDCKSEDDIELLTIDPLYLERKSDSRLEFLNDADRFVEAEWNRINDVNAASEKGEDYFPSTNETKPQFLGESLDCSTLLSRHNSVENGLVSSTLIFLARIEQSIRSSYHNFNMEDSEEKSTVEPPQVIREDLVTPPTTPGKVSQQNTVDTITSSENEAFPDNVMTPSEVEKEHQTSISEVASINANKSTEQNTNEIAESSQQLETEIEKLPFVSHQSSQKGETYFDGFLSSWKQFNEKKNFDDDVASNIKGVIQEKGPGMWHQDAETALGSFGIKDLLLVPICAVLLIRPPPSKLGVNETKAYMHVLVSEWSKIITNNLTKVKNEMKKLESNEEKASTLPDDLEALLGDESAIAKPSNGKKKKKKKKKKRKRKGVSTNNVPVQENIADLETKEIENKTSNNNEKNEKKNEETKKTSTIVVSDCAVSAMSSASIATEPELVNQVSLQPPAQNTAKTPSTSNATIQVKKSADECVVKEAKPVEEVDNHSSDGWETVEPKGGRSRRLVNSTLKGHDKQSNHDSSNNVVPQSPNAGRRNKGKTKSRHRMKQQKAKEKEVPSKSNATVEESIIKRGSTKNLKENTKNVRSTVTDQNTAQTIPDTLSGISARKTSSPPLQTLVGPGNNNSDGSSVASSLEAPHATRHKPRHSHESYKEDDVGYHLLKVCERLSDDMHAFMNRRSVALATRRRERHALLHALQGTVQNIWAGRCKVELYGSCATELDLPSSDLDVVVCGLDGYDSMEGSSSGEENSFELKDQASGSPTCSHNVSPRSYMNYPPNFNPPLSANGNRVVRLATELERQPWAVQVKAIPTASVPVIKILSDASRLPGAASQMEWMINQNGHPVAVPPGHHMSISPNAPNSYHGTTLPWRGADVMNGLLSLDITFEGPEHGGLGSTNFSLDVVNEAVKETGLQPCHTPIVQVIMVIKELLAQRRLNEPFSGGLSSYAILLLVVAVIKERRMIREEMDRVEKQRRAVSSACTTSNLSKTTEKKAQLVNKSSWAAIAKKSSSTPSGKKEPSNNVNHQNTVSSASSAQPSKEGEIKASQNQSQSIGVQDSTIFPQGSNDVLEVLCSGEPTSGKLLMHFLLFYGRHFDARTTCIDVGGTHHPEFTSISKNTNLSPFIDRKPGGTYNLNTEVYTVDQLIVYDPLPGAESNNVTRSCFAWPTISWTFDQCFNTLSGVVELFGAGTKKNRRNSGNEQSRPSESTPSSLTSDSPPSSNNSRNVDDDVSPLLELLLSF